MTQSSLPAAGQRILVAVDLGPGTDAYLAEVARWAAALGAPIDLLHVLDLGRMPPWMGDGEAERMRTRCWVELEQLRERLPIPLQGAVLVAEGSPADAITERAPGHFAVVVATRPERGLGWRLGSVATRVVKACSVPVIVFRSPTEMEES